MKLYVSSILVAAFIILHVASPTTKYKGSGSSKSGSKSKSEPSSRSPSKIKSGKGGRSYRVRKSRSLKSADLPEKSIGKSALKFIKANSDGSGVFSFYDQKAGRTRNLASPTVLKNVYKSGFDYYSRVEFKDTLTGEAVEIDVDIKNQQGKFIANEFYLYRIGSDFLFEYDDNGNRVSLQ